MKLFSNNDYYIYCSSPTLWDTKEAGVTGKWRIGNDGDFFQIEIWYTSTRQKWIFFKEKYRSTIWVDEGDIRVKEYNYYQVFDCKNT